MSLNEARKHKDYNPSSHINKLWSDFDNSYYIIIETYNNFEIYKQ